MKKITLLLIAVFTAGILGAQEDAPLDAAPPESGESQAIDPSKISYALLRNEYFLESLRQRSLARLALEEGDYDQSSWHSAEAERFAALSDAFIAKRLLLMQLSRDMQAAADRIAWAKLHQAATYYPDQLKNAEAHYQMAVDFRAEDDYAAAIENAQAAFRDLYGVAAPPDRSKDGKVILPADMPLKPNQYIVRPWDLFGDCFWNIARQFYGNPHKWPILYEANKEKIPDIHNPNLIEIGTVIDIPELGKEVRTGRYDTGKPYQP